MSGRKSKQSKFETEQKEQRMARAQEYLERYTNKHGDDVTKMTHQDLVEIQDALDAKIDNAKSLVTKNDIQS